MEYDPTECSNCRAKTQGNYCHNCGQSTSVHRITFNETIGDFFSSTFALEGQLLTTIRLMIINPGKLFREFIAGKRKSYYKPVAFFVVLTAVYLVVRVLLDYDPLTNSNIPQGNSDSIPTSMKAGQYMFTNINNIMFLLVFSIGLNQKLFFWKSYNLAEYVTVGFYVVGFYTLFGTLQMLIYTFIFSFPPQSVILIMLILIFYASISLHQRKSFWSIIKYLLLSIFSLLLYMVLGFGFSYLMVS